MEQIPHFHRVRHLPAKALGKDEEPASEAEPSRAPAPAAPGLGWERPSVSVLNLHKNSTIMGKSSSKWKRKHQPGFHKEAELYKSTPIAFAVSVRHPKPRPEPFTQGHSSTGRGQTPGKGFYDFFPQYFTSPHQKFPYIGNKRLQEPSLWSSAGQPPPGAAAWSRAINKGQAGKAPWVWVFFFTEVELVMSVSPCPCCPSSSLSPSPPVPALTGLIPFIDSGCPDRWRDLILERFD